MLQDVDLSYRAGKLTTGKNVSMTGTLDITGVATAGGSTPLQGNGPQPQDAGSLLSWAYDPAFSSTGQLTVNGTLYLIKVAIRSLAPINNIWWNASTAGVTATAGQNWAGLYSSAGTLLTSVGVDAKVTSASVAVSATLGSAYTPTATGWGWVGLLFNATTPPTVLRTNGSTTGTNNAGCAAATYRFATNGTGQTTLPSSITTSSNVAGPSIWAALS